MDRKYQFQESRGGAALTIRVTPRSRKNEISEILDDGTVKVRLTSANNEAEINKSLITFLAEILNVPNSKIEIVAGLNGKDKLVSVLDLDPSTLQKRIITRLA